MSNFMSTRRWSPSIGVSSVIALATSIIVVAFPSPAAATTLGGTHRGATPDVPFVVDNNLCTTFTDIDGNGSSDYSATETSDIVKAGVSGTVTDGSSPIANALVISASITFVGSTPTFGKLNCAVTNGSGQYTIDALKTSATATSGSITVIPPNTGTHTSPLSGLGATSLPVTSGTTTLNFSLGAATNAMAFYMWEDGVVDDVVTSPSNIACFGFDRDNNETYETNAGCTLARGNSISATVSAVDTLSIPDPENSEQNIDVVRFFLDSNPGFATYDSAWTVSGLTGGLAGLNGRWAYGIAGQESSGDQRHYLDAPFGGSLNISETPVSNVTASSQVWIARTRLVNPGGSLDLSTAAKAQISIFSRNKVGSQIRSSFRAVANISCTNPQNNEPFAGCTSAFQRLTSSDQNFGANWMTYLTSSPSGGGGGGCGSAGTGNFSGVVVSSLSTKTPVSTCGYVNAVPYSATGSGGNPGWSWDSGSVGSSVSSTGQFSLNVPATKVYRLEYTPNPGNSFARVTQIFRFTVSGGSITTVQSCDQFSLAEGDAVEADRCTSGWVTVGTDSSNRHMLLAREANLFGRVLKPDGTPVADNGNSNISVQSLEATEWGFQFRDSVTGANSSTGGAFKLWLGAGSYKLNVEAPSGETYPNLPVYVRVGSSDSGLTFSRCTTYSQNPSPNTLANALSGCTSFTSSSSSPLDVQFITGNLQGLAQADGVAEPNAQASFELWNEESQNFEWQNLWANGNQSGVFSTTLTNGTWKITVRPNWNDQSGTKTPVVAYAQVSGNAIASRGIATTKACAESSVGCDSSKYLATSGGRYVFSFGTPNFAGFAATTSSASRASNGALLATSDAVGNTWLEVQPFNVNEQDYRWSSEVSGVNISSNGRFATTLPAGNSTLNPDSKYLVLLRPRPADVAANRSVGSFRFYVDNGIVKCQIAYSFCAADAAPAAGRFDLFLGSANLTGTVEAGDNLVANGQVRAERWNGQWFDWVNLWAQTSSQGRFALNIDRDGIYRVTAEPPTWNNTYAGYANVTTYVKKSSSGLCQIADEANETCLASPTSSMNLDMELIGANVRGTVSADGQPVRNSWVNVMKFNSILGYWEWASGAPVGQNGTFSLSLAPTEDGDRSATGTQQRFKIEVMPPWGSSTLTRKEIQLWVGDVGQSSGTNYYRECSASVFADCSGSAQSGNANATLAVTLTAGNVSGKVTTDGTTGMSNAWISVEKWTTPSWARDPMWQWIELNANSNSQGNYGLNLESQGAGHYKVTANPGWNNPNNLSRTSVVVLQTANGNVCVDADRSGTCDVGSTAANPFTLNVQLTGSNLVGTLKNGSETVGFGWIGLMREQNGSSLSSSASRANTWYEWLGGANTNSSGVFGLRVESAGRYQLEINPPWNSTLTRFSVYLLAADGNANGSIESDEIRICSSKSESTDDCADNAVWSTGTNSQISFPTANVAIRVCSKDSTSGSCTAVPNAWVVVFSGYEWIAGSNTNNRGVALFSLPNGSTYRFEANPNWSNPDGSRVETGSDITIASGQLTLPAVTGAIIGTAEATATSPRQIDMKLGSPNVTGFVYYQSDGVTRVMPWAYVGVRQNLGGSNYNWLPGAPVDATGSYKLALAEGSYTLTAFPNPNVAERAPVSITVTVASNGTATCTGGVGTNSCGLDFDAAPKNVNFTMSSMGTLTRALYIYNGSNLVMSVAKSPISGSVAMSFTLAEGTYTLRVQALNTVATDGTTEIVDFNLAGRTTSCREFTLTVGANGTISSANQTALEAWATSFSGNDATTGLECTAAAS